MSQHLLPASEFNDADRRAVAAVATQFFINGMTFASFIPRLPEVRDRLDVSLDVLGALLTIAGAIGLIGSVMVAPLVDRFGTRRILLIGACVLIATLPAIGFASSAVVFVVALGLMGALDVVVDVSMNLQGSWLSARRHAPIMNRLHGLWSLGTVVGGLGAAQLTSMGVSLRAHLIGVAVILGVALIYVGRGLLRVDEHAQPEAPALVGSRVKTPRSALIMLGLAGSFAIAVELVSSDWAAFRLRDDFALSAGASGLAYVAFTSGMTIGRFGGDWIQSRLGDSSLNRVASVAATAGLALAALAPDQYLVVAGYGLAGLGISTFFPRLYDQAAQLSGRRGAGLGALTAGSRITALIVPSVVGALAASPLSVGAATAIVVLPSVLGFALVTWRE